MKKIGIALDSWKKDIFERHLKQNGYTWVDAGELTRGVVVFQVQTENRDALHRVILAANTEAAMSKGAK